MSLRLTLCLLVLILVGSSGYFLGVRFLSPDLGTELDDTESPLPDTPRPLLEGNPPPVSDADEAKEKRKWEIAVENLRGEPIGNASLSSERDVEFYQDGNEWSVHAPERTGLSIRVTCSGYESAVLPLTTEETQIIVRLHPSPTPGVTAWVTWVDMRPCEGARVELLSLDEKLVLASGSSDAQGRWFVPLTGLPEGIKEAVFKAEYRLSEATSLRAVSRVRLNRWAHVPLRLWGKNVPTKKVTIVVNRDQLADPDGRPNIVHRRVNLETSLYDGASGGTGAWRYTWTLFGPGKYRLQALVEDKVWGWVDVSVDEGDTVDQTFVLEPRLEGPILQIVMDDEGIRENFRSAVFVSDALSRGFRQERGALALKRAVAGTGEDWFGDKQLYGASFIERGDAQDRLNLQLPSYDAGWVTVIGKSGEFLGRHRVEPDLRREFEDLILTQPSFGGALKIVLGPKLSALRGLHLSVWDGYGFSRFTAVDPDATHVVLSELPSGPVELRLGYNEKIDGGERYTGVTLPVTVAVPPAGRRAVFHWLMSE